MQDKMDYAQEFDLKPEELALKILICTEVNKQSSTEQLLPTTVEYINSKQLQNKGFPDQSFDLALCTDFLFANGEEDQAVYLSTLLELVRVASEVRVFPLVNQKGEPSQYLGAVIQALQEKGMGVEVRQVMDTKQGSSNAMLRIWNPACLINNAEAVTKITLKL